MGQWWGEEESLEVIDSRDVGATCPACGGEGLLDPPDDGRNHNPPRCDLCGGVGFHGIDPAEPAPALPGSALKVAYLVARYAAGMELFDARDGIDG